MKYIPVEPKEYTEQHYVSIAGAHWRFDEKTSCFVHPRRLGSIHRSVVTNSGMVIYTRNPQEFRLHVYEDSYSIRDLGGFLLVDGVNRELQEILGVGVFTIKEQP